MILKEAVIVAAVRTPVAKIRGSLAAFQADEIGAFAVREAVKRAKIDPAEIEDVFWGNARNIDLQTPARVVALAAGLPISVPGQTVERGCGSALCAIHDAALSICAGEGDIFVAGGVESCTHGPFIVEKQLKPGNRPPRYLPGRMVPENMENLPMGMTAEVVAQQYGITREDCDAFGLLSQQRAAAAWDAGYFDDQIIPIEVPGEKKGTTRMFTRDETVRETTMESLGKLKPSFCQDGVSTAGNSSPLTDGAAAVVMMSREVAEARGLEILGVYRGFSVAGLDPRTMGLGPIYSTRKLLEKTGLTVDDIDLIEINEAFAAQSVACVRELGLDMDKVNVNGGAIALGHPFGATGAILVTKMVYELKRRNLHRGLITFCIGGGQGAAMLIERP